MKNSSELTTALPLSFTSVPIPSSPVEQGDLYDYILWHIKITPRLKFQFRHAYKILEDKCYDLQTIQQWKCTAYEEKWEKTGIEPGIGIRLAHHVSKFARQLKQQSSEHDSESIIVPPPSESCSSSQSLSKNFRPNFNVRPLTSSTRTTQKALLVKRSHLVFIAILVFGQSPDPRVWHDTVRAPSAPGTEPQRVGYGVHGRCRCEPWGQDILHLSKRQTV